MLIRWTTPLALGFGALLAALGAGCSSSNGDPELVSQADFPEHFADVWCRAVAPCCTTAQILYDSAACQAQARAFASELLASRVDGDTAYSPNAGTQCLARLAHALAGCEIEDASVACSLIFVGSAAEGVPCANSSQCASGYCALGETGLSGVCAVASYRSPKHGKLGEPCVGSCGVPGSFECPDSLLPDSEGTSSYCYAEDGLFCTFDSSSLDTLTCQPYVAIAGACNEAELRCVPGAFCADGTCVAQRASGPCQDTPEQCDAGSYCDAARQCRAKKANGTACASGEECGSSSCSSDGQSTGVCDSGNTLLAQACSGAL